ncbi:hypothetical protein B0186_10465 [Canicola haemoglobinophilus]|uniref:Predicted membrane protein n=1 Tax=Canicola haemoglobinophilus TaxID=733 RepID=A0A1V4AYR1_9PAST|nr:Fe-S-containing protein [Canicola haemoglobinophilus]OOR97158.1 hypothetical protein B0186_10465 [Canicola haemoglobinophilus]STO60765.1 Predicted membrane protein [Canicola haemoglobinophilus]
MNYYFTFLLQSILPIAILLGCHWGNKGNIAKIHIKSLRWLTISAILIGSLIHTFIPQGQQANLIFNITLLSLFILFALCQIPRNKPFAQFWHFIFVSIATLLWLKDPNISAITNTDVINTDFILHLSAVIFGLFFCIFVTCLLIILFKQTQSQQKLTALLPLTLGLFILLIMTPIISEIMLSLMKLQVLELTKVRLTFVAKSANIITYFNYINAFILLVILCLFAITVHKSNQNLVANEIDPIEKRKRIATMQSSKRTLICGFLIVISVFSTQLYWDKIASQPPRLSEAQQVTLDQNNQIHIPIEQVKDGKLHRFVWINSDGKAVRFFIINRSTKKISLATVFDACILCGDQGYVMEGDQVVCIGCGVRIFIPSIGKPGGCNPVPIENWQQTDTHVVINRKSLEEGLNYFSTIVELEVTDPVDQTKLKNTSAEYKYSHEGMTYFFSNENNLNLFRDNPEKYLAQPK